jgi:NAD(P)-dependent dehydrogenase (short-subunit alcohol dehydrogenase family)
MKIQSRAEALEAYASLPPREVLAAEIEYGGFEQTVRNQYELAGQVALVDRALSNQARVAELLAKGAAVIGLDDNLAVKALHPRPEFLGLRCDPDNPTEMEAALEQSVRRFGGIDLLIADNPSLAAACEPLLELSPIKSCCTAKDARDAK